jgi:NAD-dependent DNA ligase
LKIVEPTNCPSCSYLLERVKDQLFCRNVSCTAQSLKKVQHFCSLLKIKGFGPKTLEALGYSTVDELLAYDSEHVVECGYSEKVALKLELEIEKLYTVGVDFPLLITALSIDMIGITAARKIAAKVKDLDELDTFQSAKACGLGDKAATSLITWLQVNWPSMRETLREVKIIHAAQVAEAKGNVCITGKLNDYKSRALATEYLISLGWTVKSAVSSKVDFLVCEDGSNSSAVTKAIANEIPIVTIKELP